MIKRLKNFREYIAIVVAIAMFFISPYLLRMVDPTAAAYDAGIIQIPVVAVMNFFFFTFTTWFTINLIWPEVAKYFKEFFNTDLIKLEPWQKMRMAVFLYCYLLLMLVMLSRVIG